VEPLKARAKTASTCPVATLTIVTERPGTLLFDPLQLGAQARTLYRGGNLESVRL